MMIDEKIWREILKQYAASDPRPPNCDELIKRFGIDTISAHLRYLRGHGLLQYERMNMLTYVHECHQFSKEVVEKSYITAKGHDFLSKDGGLSAILKQWDTHLK